MRTGDTPQAGLVLRGSQEDPGVYLGHFEPDKRGFSFVQISGIHMSHRGMVVPEYLAEDLEQIQVEAPEIDFIVVTGDLTHEATEGEMRFCSETLDQSRVPVFTLPGNHDALDDPGLERYRKAFGPPWYSFDWGPVHFVAYDCITDEREGEAFAGRAWLRSDLKAQPPGRPTLFLTHYQLDDGFYKLLDEYDVRASISGHWHASRIYFDGRRTHFNGPTLCMGSIDYSPRAYRVFTWADGALRTRTVALGKGRPKHIAGAGFRPIPAGRPTARAKRIDASGSWGQLLGGASRSSRVDGELAAPPLEEVWCAELPGVIKLGSPVLAQGRVYVGTLYEEEPGRGHVVCLRAETGEEIWRRRVGDSVKNSLALWSDLVIGVTVTGRLFALDAGDGTLRWETQLGDPSRRWIYHAPLIANDLVYAGSPEHFAAVRAESGEVVWVRSDLGKSDWICSYVSPTEAAGAIVTGFFWQPVGLVALEPDTGEDLWVHRTGGGESAVSTPVADGPTLYVMRHSGELQRIDARSGKLEWTFEGGARWSPASPVCDDARVYAAFGRGRVVALSKTAGELLWERPLPGQILDMASYVRAGSCLLGSPLLSSGRLYVPSASGHLFVLDTQRGDIAGSWENDLPLASAPVPCGNAILQADVGGRLHALGRG